MADISTLMLTGPKATIEAFQQKAEDLGVKPQATEQKNIGGGTDWIVIAKVAAAILPPFIGLIKTMITEKRGPRIVKYNNIEIQNPTVDDIDRLLGRR